MTLLLLGLVLFLGVHSTRIVADGWRTATIARIGEKPWKGIYSLLSIAGFVLLVIGYGAARQAPVVLFAPPVWTRHLAALLTIPAFVLLAAAYVPGNAIKRAVGHPMMAGVKVWALAHLLANGTLADLLLFGTFLAWAVLGFIAARRRDRAAGTIYPAGPGSRTAIAVTVGLVAWAVFAFALHRPLIGVAPFG
ncbi:MAG: NnrU family protein [Betaproteobacteria bacterium]